MRSPIYISVLLVVFFSACESPDNAVLTFEPLRVEQDAGTEALFIGISPVDENTVWLAGFLVTWRFAMMAWPMDQLVSAVVLRRIAKQGNFVADVVA